MNNHGHVRPNPDGSRARCGGPGICMECSLEADAYKLSAMGGCNSCNDLESKLSAAEKERDDLRGKLAVAKERDELKAKLAVAKEALEFVAVGKDRSKRYCFIHENISEIAREALKAINKDS